MKTIQAGLVMVAIAAPGMCLAAMVPLNVVSDAGESKQIVYVGNIGYFQSHIAALTLLFDTDADTATMTDMTLTYQGENQTVVREYPSNFPNPPISLTEMITFDPVSAPTSLTSAQTVPLSASASSFGAKIPFSLSFPTDFVISGLYKVTGPTQSATVPFSTRFSALPESHRDAFIFMTVTPGNNFPTTTVATVREFSILSPVYEPASPVLFAGTIDGVPVSRSLNSFRLWNSGAPEPSSVVLGVIAAIGGATRIRRR